jgi:hypothetical protein
MIIRKAQFKTTMRYHLMHVRKTTAQSVDMYNVQVSKEKSTVAPQQVKTQLPYYLPIAFLSRYQQQLKEGSQKIVAYLYSEKHYP